MTDVARVFEVLAGEDVGYLGGTPHGQYAAVAQAATGVTPSTAAPPATGVTPADVDER